MAVENPPAAPHGAESTVAHPLPREAPAASSWRQPWWHPALGFPLYLLGGLLILAGLGVGAGSVIVNGFEVVAVGLLAADAWNVRKNTPLLKSANKKVAALGWAAVLLATLILALAVPAV